MNDPMKGMSDNDGDTDVARDVSDSSAPMSKLLSPGTVNVEMDPYQTRLVSSFVQSWHDNDHYKRIMHEASLFTARDAANDLGWDKLLAVFSVQIVEKEKEKLNEKLQEVLIQDFVPILDAAADDEDRCQAIMLRLMAQHSGAPQAYYVLMTAAALLNAGCTEAAVASVLALLDDSSFMTGDDPDCELDVSLHFAARSGHERLLQLLLRLRGTNVNTWWNLARGAAIHFAAEFDHGGVMQVLLDSPGIKVRYNPCCRGFCFD